MEAHAARVSHGSRTPPLAGRLATAGVARLVGFVPLALFAALHWGDLLEPTARAAMLTGVVAAAVAGGLLLSAFGTVTGWRRAAAGAGSALALLVVSLVAAGVPPRLLVPDAWPELVAGLAQGAASLPAISVPYRGADEWVRSAFVAGGVALTGLGALLAFWPRGRPGAVGFPLAAAVALGALYAIPVIQRGPEQPFLSGAAFCVLLALFLGLERLRDDQVGVGIACLAVATGLGLFVAPRLDRPEPWLDYEQLAESLQPERAATFNWNHSYSPLDWPRDGREILRVRARNGAYWKTVNLGDFDGVRWVTDSNVRRASDTAFERGRRDWFQTIRVINRGLRSRHFVGAGHMLRILPDGPAAVSLAPGTFQTVRGPLEPGSAYHVRVYVPRPSERRLRNAGTDYPTSVGDELDVEVPNPNPGIAPATLRFPAFGSFDTEPEVLLANGFQPEGGREVIAGSALGPVHELAQSLRAESDTPYELVQRVRERVQQGATYTESPPPSRNPLVDFLFTTHEGYCQQFSGAMALLLRMGGVPARVASGFSPGRFDRKRGEYIVRDDDAHSWVEAYFPGIGWHTFDPTPAASPARSQLTDESPAAATGSGADAPALGQSGDRPFAPGDPGAIAAPEEGGTSRELVIVLGAFAVLLLGGALLLMRRGRLPGEAIAPELAELQRALHRSGRTPPANMTLTRLEGVLGGSDGARGYLRALREQRFGAGGAGPTPAQRRALRRELASGLGVRGRLRAWWALPPVRRRRRGAPYTG